MSIDEIVNEIIRLVRARDTNGGHFHHEPHKGDFFRLFIAAWDAGLLKRSGPNTLKLDSLINIVGNRDPTIFDGETWLMFCAAWPEWDYAWANATRNFSIDDAAPGGLRVSLGPPLE
jgi:hypothetical protein